MGEASLIEPIGGDVVAGRYRLADRLGEGAAGTVWLARDTHRDIDVAVKVLKAEVVASEAVLQRFIREADVSERMLSPHIVKVLARGIHDGAPYIVYEHLDGEDLFTRLAQGPALSIPDIEAVIVHTCRALARSHAVGVLHRDIKPENLFIHVDAAGHLQLKVVDFGVSDLLGDPRAADAIVGTLEYIAPEVMLNERPPGTVSDLYALGVVAYECCTGRVPYAGETLGELLIALANGQFDPATAFRPDLPPAIDGWFARALHRDPDARFGSAKEMAEQAHLVLKRKTTPSLPNMRRTASSQEIVRISSLIAKVDAPPPSMPAPRPKMPSFVFEEERPSSAYMIIKPGGDER